MDIQTVVNVTLVLGVILSGLTAVSIATSYFAVSNRLFQMELDGALRQEQDPQYEAVWLMKMFVLRHALLNLTR